MKLSITTLALIAYSQAVQISSDQSDASQRFSAWANQFNRNYNSKSERDMRFSEWLGMD
jgi:hypothetical protein